MGRRMSNRDRIERLRAEAAAAEREKAKRRAGEGEARLKLVWAVKDPGGEVLCTYPYPQRDMAEAEARRRRAGDGRSYFVAPEKVPLDA